MRNLILIVHTSLDGFAAGEHGELDGFEPGEENLEFVCKLTEDADAALFGRTSYQLLDKYWPSAYNHPDASKGQIKYSNWYNSVQKIVLSRTMSEVNLNNVTIIGDDIPTEINKIKEQSGKDILIFGSPAASQTLMHFDLIDSYWIFINPIIFGKGIPLFKAGLNDKMKLKLVATKQFSNGELALNYIVIR